jgi:membrane-associated phospholipid phosphatase
MTSPIQLSPPKSLRVGAVVARILVVVGFFAAWWAVYAWTNARGCESGRAIYLTRPCDEAPSIIQPWTAVVYLVGGLVLPLLPFCYYRDWPRLGFVLTCYTIASALAFACYVQWPVGIVRPPYDGSGFGNWLMRHVLEVDDEANCFPSSHVIFAVLPAVLVDRGGASRLVRLLVWGLAGAVCVSTVTTGQHYVLDVAGGVGAALASYYTARRLFFSLAHPE